MPEPKNFFIKTFGCQMNVYDSDKMKDIFLANNIHPTEDFFNADYIVLNTCHIREKATEKTDGQNLFISWTNKLVAARNTGDIIFYAGSSSNFGVGGFGRCQSPYSLI